jgi:hypothetical protein
MNFNPTGCSEHSPFYFGSKQKPIRIENDGFSIEIFLGSF